MRSRGVWLIVILIGFVAVALDSVRSQDAPNTHIVLYMDRETFTIYIPEGASSEMLRRIQELVFVYNNGSDEIPMRLIDRNSASQFIQIIEAGGGNCLGYKTADDIPNPSIPEGCNDFALNPLNEFSAFWYQNNQFTSFTVMISDQRLELCAAGEYRCIVNLFPELAPTATPTATTTLTLSPSPIAIFPTTPSPTASVIVTLTLPPPLPAGEQCAMPIETRPVAATNCYQPGAFNASSVDSKQCVSIEGFNMSVHEITVEQASCGTEPSQLPRTSLTVEEAQQRCQTFGGRLPTAAEWEYAARGPEYRLFPWGNEQNEEFYVHIRSNALGPKEVISTESSTLNDVSWAEIKGMMGNASEWTASLNPDGSFVVFGGAFKDDPIDHGTGILSTRNDYQSLSTDFIGFRCVFPLEAMPQPTSTHSNSAWTPIEQNFDGVSMVYVPAGCFEMGSNASEPDESPAHSQCLEPFWIDQYEVKNLDFMSMGGTSATANRSSTVSQPVENLTWFEAKAFCELRGGRLPTEREWEYAARGPSNWLYPWGSDPTPDNTVWNGNSAGQTAVVGSHPADKSWVGAFDMAGNVKEWVSTIYDGFSYPYKSDDGRENTTSIDPTVRRVARGSAWESGFESFHASNRSAYTPDQWRNFIGFRCVRPA